jgi:formylglycine-generating enzyme required for sulfatase activity
LRQYRPFSEARAYAISLGLNSQPEWKTYAKSGKRPQDIPASPHRVYAKDGWVGIGDWLGTGRVANRFRQFRSFNEARAFARRLRLKSEAEWRAYCKSGKKPANIPASPMHTYADDGWVGMGDWLGTGTIASYLRKYRSFEEARAFARNLGLRSQNEWKDYCRSGEKPDDIPSKPDNSYADAGWAGMGDWLGYAR